MFYAQITNGQSERPEKLVAYESPIEEFYFDRYMVPMEKPLGKMKIEAMIQAAVEQTNTRRKNMISPSIFF